MIRLCFTVLTFSTNKGKQGQIGAAQHFTTQQRELHHLISSPQKQNHSSPSLGQARETDNALTLQCAPPQPHNRLPYIIYICTTHLATLPCPNLILGTRKEMHGMFFFVRGVRTSNGTKYPRSNPFPRNRIPYQAAASSHELQKQNKTSNKTKKRPQE